MTRLVAPSRLVAPFRLALLELKRFRTPLQIAGLAFLLCVPLLYGATYLWSNWNPDGRIDQVPVAVVNQDQPVTVSGQQVAGGATLVAELRARPLLGWRFVSADEASRGIGQGRYYAIITVPPDFSARLASGATGPPVRAEMSVRLDDANNYLVGVMAETVQSELQRQISAAAVETYFKVAFGKLGTLKSGLSSAASGGASLRSGLARASSGTAGLVTGLGKLRTGTGTLAPVAAAVAAGVHQVTSLAAPVASRLAGDLPALVAGSAAATRAATSLSGTAAAFSQGAADGSDIVLRWVRKLPHEVPGIARSPGYRSLLADARQASAALASGLARLVASRPAVARVPDYGLLKLVTELDTQAHQENQQAQRTYQFVATVNNDVLALGGRVPALQSRLRGAASQLHQLDTGAAQVAAGVRSLHGGAGSALHGADKLKAGNSRLLSGATQLASGLTSATSQVPAFGPAAAGILASPVTVTVSNAHPASVYGRGLAPFFFPIALWVFGIVAFLLLRPVSGRLLASQAGSFVVALTAWLPVLALGTAATLLLYGVVDLCLGLRPVSPLGTIGLMLLGVATFSAIVHVLRLAFGAAGDALALVLLIVQLVSCGGLYPVQTLPLPLRAVNQVIPMTYLVRALRVTISGGNDVLLRNSCLVLGGYLIAALLLLWLVVARHRVWTMARLKPELEL